MKGKKRWEKHYKELTVEIGLKIPQNTGTIPGSLDVWNRPKNRNHWIQEPLKEQENITDEILDNQRQINDEVDEQAGKQRRVNEEKQV